MKNWRPPYSKLAKSTLLWFAWVLFFPSIVMVFTIQDCHASGIDKLVWERDSKSIQLTKVPLFASDNLWAGIGYQRNSIPCGDGKWCQEWLYESSSQIWGIELGLHSKDIDRKSEIFLGANAGSRKGLLTAIKEKVNPLATEYLTFFISFVLFF